MCPDMWCYENSSWWSIDKKPVPATERLQDELETWRVKLDAFEDEEPLLTKQKESKASFKLQLAEITVQSLQNLRTKWQQKWTQNMLMRFLLRS